MARIILSLFLAVSAVFGFSQKCLSCHASGQAPDLEMIYYRYLMVYGSNTKVKEHMKAYLLDPSFKKALMPRPALERFGLHPRVGLSSDELDKIIDEYIRAHNPSRKIIFK